MTRPRDDSPLKPKLSRMTETAAIAAPPQSMTVSGWAGTDLSRVLSSRFPAPSTATRAKDQRQPIVEAKLPAMSSASTPAAGIAAAR